MKRLPMDDLYDALAIGIFICLMPFVIFFIFSILSGVYDDKTEKKNQSLAPETFESYYQKKAQKNSEITGKGNRTSIRIVPVAQW